MANVQHRTLNVQRRVFPIFGKAWRNGCKICSSRPVGDFFVQSDSAVVEMHCKMTLDLYPINLNNI